MTSRTIYWVTLFIASIGMLCATLACGSAAGDSSLEPEVRGGRAADAGRRASPNQPPPPGPTAPEPASPMPRTPDGGVAPNQLTVVSVTPASATTTQGDVSITVAGSGFANGVKVTLAGQELTTQFVSSTSLTGTILGTQLAALPPGTAAVGVRTAGGQQSSAVAFTVTAGQVTISALDPQTAEAGSAALTLTVTGTGFVQGNQVSFGGQLFPATITASSRLTVQVPASALTSARDVPVVVQGTGTASVPRTFRVTSATPVFTTLTPAEAYVGQGSLAVTIIGSGFQPGVTKVAGSWSIDAPDYVRYEVSNVTVVSSNQIQAVLAAGWFDRASSIYLEVFNSTSNPARYSTSYGTIRVSEREGSGAPQVTSLAPSALPAGSGGQWISIAGSGFSSQSGVRLDGVYYSAATTDWLSVPSSTRMDVYFYERDLATPTQFDLTPYNESAGQTLLGSTVTLTVY